MKIPKKIPEKRGAAFVTVVIISMLVIFVAVSASNMLLQDVHMIRHLKYSAAAQYLAEAGISDAVVTLVNLGFSAKDNVVNFPQTNLGEGTYDVTVTQSGGRVLLTSEGVVEGVSRTVSLEVKDNTPTALYNMMSCGTDLMFRALLFGWADINGDIHANRDLRLHALWAGSIDVATCGEDCCAGDVSAGRTVTWLGNVTIHGSTTNGAPSVTFPNFDYAYYKGLVAGTGDYHSGDKTWQDATISPTKGIVYVEGTARFRGNCTLNGGIVADRILVLGSLTQNKSGIRNVIISRTQDIRIYVKLAVEEAVVYAGRDFRIFNAGSIITVTGTLIARRYLRAWDAVSDLVYNHKLIYPDGLVLGSGGSEGLAIGIVSWNR